MVVVAFGRRGEEERSLSFTRDSLCVLCCLIPSSVEHTYRARDTGPAGQADKNFMAPSGKAHIRIRNHHAISALSPLSLYLSPPPTTEPPFDFNRPTLMPILQGEKLPSRPYHSVNDLNLHFHLPPLTLALVTAELALKVGAQGTAL
jgi:hypothetical protein